MATLAIIDKAAPRFAGDFDIEIADGMTPDGETGGYLETLATVLGNLAADEENDRRSGRPESIVTARAAIREATAAALRQEAEAVAQGTLAADTAHHNALVRMGMYRAERDRLASRLFAVDEVFADVGTGPLGRPLAADLVITVGSGLPAPNDVPTKEQEDLFVAIGEALTVVKTVTQRMQRPTLRGRLRLAETTTPEVMGTRAGLLLDEYVRKLAGIARLGLVGSQTALAALALDGMRSEFVAREAGRIKNSYVRSLGVAAGITAAIFLIAYGLIVPGVFGTSWSWAAAYSPFLLAGTGACIGCWLSFSIRRVSLPFAQLGVLEEDLLDPSLRIVFVVGLTLVAVLLFWTGALSIDVGELRVNKAGFITAGANALLVGVFCGIAERGLATAIGGRAEAFAGSLAGGR